MLWHNILSFAVAVSAFPKDNYAVKPWLQPLPTDSRSPCPGLNILANHGYLPHDGRRITADDIANAAAEGFNFEREFIRGVATTLFDALAPNTTVIDLLDLNAPGKTEGRASTTREDSDKGGDTLHLNPGRLAALLADSTDLTFVDISGFARARKRVEALVGPPAATEQEITGGAGTVGLILAVTSEQDAYDTKEYSMAKVRKDILSVWYGQERLPVEKGWKKPTTERISDDVGGVTQAVLVAKQSV